MCCCPHVRALLYRATTQEQITGSLCNVYVEGVIWAGIQRCVPSLLPPPGFPYHLYHRHHLPTSVAATSRPVAATTSPRSLSSQSPTPSRLYRSPVTSPPCSCRYGLTLAAAIAVFVMVPLCCHALGSFVSWPLT